MLSCGCLRVPMLSRGCQVTPDIALRLLLCPDSPGAAGAECGPQTHLLPAGDSVPHAGQERVSRGDHHGHAQGDQPNPPGGVP